MPFSTIFYSWDVVSFMMLVCCLVLSCLLRLFLGFWEADVGVILSILEEVRLPF